MAFGHKAGNARRYAYHIIKPPQDSDAERLCTAQLYKARKFQNELVAIERERFLAVRDAALRASPRLAELEDAVSIMKAELKAIFAQIAADKTIKRTNKIDETLRDQAKTKKRELKAIRDEARAARNLAYKTSQAKAEMAKIEKIAKDKVSAARTAAVRGGLYWATSLDVITRIPRAGKVNMKTKRIMGLPKFKQWDGSGSIAIQFGRKGVGKETEPVLLKNGLPRISPLSGKPMYRKVKEKLTTIANVFAGTTLLKLERRLDEKGEAHPRFCRLHFRVGSDAKKEPIWACFNKVVMHRAVPEDAAIKWAHLVRTRIGTRFRWSVQFVLNRKAWPRFPANRTRGTSGTLAVALGWRKIDGDLRVAYWAGSDGREGEIMIPEAKLGLWAKANDLHSTRETQFNRSRDFLAAWLATKAEADLPEEFRRRTENLSQWQAANRLAALMRHWQLNRFAGDEEIYPQMEGAKVEDGFRTLKNNKVVPKHAYTAGSRQDTHLYDWESYSRLQGQRWRKHYYIEEVLRLAEQYRDVVVANIDWHALGRDPSPEDMDEKVNKANKGIASVGKLNELFTTYMAPTEVDPAGIVSTCHKCGGPCAPVPKANRWVVCEACGGEREDRARNAAKNLLAMSLPLGERNPPAREAGSGCVG
jgi:hypothetical protein